MDVGAHLSTANGISWGGLGPQMFGINGVYHMVPICLAIGVFLPLPFIAAVSVPGIMGAFFTDPCIS